MAGNERWTMNEDVFTIENGIGQPAKFVQKRIQGYVYVQNYSKITILKNTAMVEHRECNTYTIDQRALVIEFGISDD